MKCLIAHPGIAPFIKQSVLAYQEQGILDKFHTSYFQHPEYPFSRKLISLFPRLKKEFTRRNIEEIQYQHLKGNPLPEMFRVILARLKFFGLENRVWEWSELNFDRWVARNLQPNIQQWVHTYEHAALSTIRKARTLNMLSFYEQPSQHHSYLTTILNEQLNKYPELMGPATRLMYDEQANARKDQELRECDYIICNSAFTLKTLTDAGISKQKIIKIPYGFPETIPHQIDKPQGKKIMFLYAGNQHLRKGIHILYKAWELCHFDPQKAELVLIGASQLPDSLRQGLPSSIRFMPNMPHQELMEFYHQANVFVLPTLADGFGMVISEAMSNGLPVITTMNSGGPDVITHHHNGLLVEANNIQALANELIWCYHHPERLTQIGKNALETAKAYPWSAYRKKLVEEVLSRVEQHQEQRKVKITC